MTDLSPHDVADPGSAVAWSREAPECEAAAPARSVAAFVRQALPGLVVAALIGWFVGPVAGAVVAAVVLVVSAAAVMVPQVGRGLARAFDFVGRIAGSALTFVVLGIVFVLAFVPVGVVRRVLRTDPLRLGEPGPETAWVGRRGWSARRLPDRLYASEGDLITATGRGRVTRVIGALSVLVLIDLVVGSVLIGPPVPASTAGVPGGGPEAIPALAGEPYVTRLFIEIFSAGSGDYDPFLGWRLRDVDGDHLNIVDGERVSFRAEGGSSDPVVIWFFGGSTMYGFGQRDEHTIPSEVVRAAERDGLVVEAHNFGTPAYDNWQETQLFARLLTEREAPDVAIFYDGYNDISQQLLDGPHTEPSHALARAQQTAIENADQPVAAEDVRAWWADHSAVTNVTRRVRDRLDGDPPQVQLTRVDARVPADVRVGEVISSTETLLDRGRAIAAALADRYDVEVQHWWQPTLYTRDPVAGEEGFFEQAENRSPAWSPVVAGLIERLPGDVVDLSDATDDLTTPVYWDTVHTNEDGAAAVAAAGYRALEPLLRQVTTG